MKRLISIVLVLILLLAVVPATSVLAATDTVDVQVERDADDCVRFVGGRYSDEASYVSVGSNSTSDYKHGSGMRFNDVDVPHGTTIVEAYITITARSSNSGDDVVSYISAERNSNPSSFSGDNAATFDKRWKNNTVEVKWDNIESWSKGEEYESPNIKKVVQEIVDRSDWEDGNSIVVFWEDFGDRSDTGAYRVGYSHDSSHSKAAVLHVEYTYTDDDAYDGDAMSELETQVEALRLQSTVLDARLTELGGMITSLESHIDDLSIESGPLLEGYSSLRTEVANLSTNLAGMRSAVANLETETLALERALALTERLNEIESSLSKKLGTILWLIVLPLVVVAFIIGYFVLRRQR